MKHTNWRPLIIFGLLIGLILFIGLGFLALIFSGSGDVGPGISPGGYWPGMWGLGPFGLIFPCFGLVMILFMMFFFFRMMTGGGPMSGMMGHGGPMSGMMGHRHDPQAQSQVSRAEPQQDTCPSCESPIQADWKVCPHCGQELA